jgi:murein DD-endopeptidase MepM/ murein hydrolase activator NlpD
MKPPIKNMELALYPAGDVTQWFGENYDLYMRAIGTTGHNGVDLVRKHGEPMYAIEDGTIVNVKDDAGGFGKHLRLLSDEPDKDGLYNLWVYAHNSINLVQVGQKVKAGQHICNMGNTGFVISGATPYWKVNPYAGTHLHIGVRKVKRPRRGGWSYEGSDIKIDVVNYDNGFKGSIDPRPILAAIPRETVTDPRIPLMQQVITLQKKLLELLRKR